MIGRASSYSSGEDGQWSTGPAILDKISTGAEDIHERKDTVERGSRRHDYPKSKVGTWPSGQGHVGGPAYREAILRFRENVTL